MFVDLSVEEDVKPNIAAASNSRRRATVKMPRRSILAERRADELRRDPQIAAVEPSQVLCKMCNQWIRLQINREYDTWNWQKHAPLCAQRNA